MTKYNFEAETGRLLELLTHSIYSNKEIWLRELVSNSSDAIDKARIKSLTDTNYLWDDKDFQIKLDINKDENTIILTDNGIWMTKEEVQKNIWTIAKSGTKEFIEKLKEAKDSGDNNLIGQFGVWFYSVFMIADKVELETKSNESDEAIKWISDGKWSYELDKSDKKTRWTIIKIFLKEDSKEYLDDFRLRTLIKKYSNYVWVPIMMKEAEDENDKTKIRQYERVNETKSIWTKNKSEVKKEEYSEFYKSISYDFSEPLTNLHLNLEGVTSYKSLLFIPQKNSMMPMDANSEYGPKLYVQNVLILENTKELLPVWLRFVKWVVETWDLPLNISRELLQSNSTLDKIKKSLTKKIIDKLSKQITKNKENYDDFLENYSSMLKEWVHYDTENREKIASLIKYESLLKWSKITFDEYLEEFKWEEKTIYFITWSSKKEILVSPYLSNFKEKWVDVMLLDNPIDEWLVDSLKEYKWVKLKSVVWSDINLEEETEEIKKEKEEKTREFKDLLDLVKNTIWVEKLEEVKLSDRFSTDVPAALATKDWAISPQMEKIYKSMWQAVPSQKRVFELNPKNTIVESMMSEFKKDIKSEKLKDLIFYSYDQALLREGWELDNVWEFLERLNKFVK